VQRYAACLEYCGINYVGWQRQDNGPSVQAEVERAFARVADHPVVITAAGRTDTGVHGIGQTIHFDSDSPRTGYNWLRGVNTALPADISLIWTHPVDNEFHARFGALRRRYRYVLLNRAVSPSYLDGRVGWECAPLALLPMQAASRLLLGTHDFSAYRAAGCQSRNPVKTLYRLDVNQADHWFWFDVEADGFLHHMVRNLVGVLCRIGRGDATPDWAQDVLLSRDRRRGGKTFPASGLYFVQVEYDPVHQLPPPPPVCRFW